MSPSSGSSGWKQDLEAAHRKMLIAEYHATQLHEHLDPNHPPSELPIAAQAHFEGVLYSVIAAFDQVAQAINSALFLHLKPTELGTAFDFLEAPALEPVQSWLKKPIGRDVRSIRTKATHHSYEKVLGGLQWQVQAPDKVTYSGSRELNNYCAAAVDYVRELDSLLDLIEASLLAPAKNRAREHR